MNEEDRILEEVTLPGTKTIRSKCLRADFYIPNRNLIVEVHGEQHFRFNAFHFDDKLAFFRAQARDRNKADWCKLNEIRFQGNPPKTVPLKYSIIDNVSEKIRIELKFISILRIFSNKENSP